jgi:hypothetical protein
MWSGRSIRCFPHAIIVGAQKGGTTALFAHFLMRPDFEAPAAKEVSSSLQLEAHSASACMESPPAAAPPPPTPTPSPRAPRHRTP